MRRSSISIIKEETAAVAIVVGLLITAFVGFLAIVVDVGYMYEMRRQLQSAADAAALAGMTEIINDRAPDPIAKTYAEFNDLIDPPEPLQPLETQLLDASNQEIDDPAEADAYRVSVSKRANLAFAPIFGFSSSLVGATAQAKRVYVTGLRNLLPWGVGTIKATDVQARLGEDFWVSLDPAGSDLWSDPLTVPAAAAGVLVDIQIINGQGWPETFFDAAAVTIDKPGDSVSNVRLTNNNLLPSGTTELQIYSTTKPDKVLWNGKQYNVIDAGGGLYTLGITAPSASEMTKPFEAYPINVKISAQETHNNAAVLIVRNRNSPVSEVSLAPSGWLAPGAGAVTINVRMREFEYGQEYTLKLAGDPVAGNFMSLDYSYILHADGSTDEFGGSGYQYSDAYGEWIYGGFPKVISIGDTIWTQSGGGPQPQIESWINARVDGCALSLENWELAGRPSDCGKLVVVPIVELKEKNNTQAGNGKSPVVVYRFAAFYITTYQREPGFIGIRGQFVEYVEPGENTQDDDPGGFSVEAVRLVRPD